jgi:hypothetical protein
MVLALGMASPGAQVQPPAASPMSQDGEPVLRVYDEPCLVDAVHEYISVTLPAEVVAQNRPWNTRPNFLPPDGHEFGRHPREAFKDNRADDGICPTDGFGALPPAVTAFAEALAARGQTLQGNCPFPFEGVRYGLWVDNGNRCDPGHGDAAVSVCLVPSNRSTFSITTQRDFIQYDVIRNFIIANGKAPQCIRRVSATSAVDLQTITDGFVRALDLILRPAPAPAVGAPPASPN